MKTQLRDIAPWLTVSILALSVLVGRDLVEESPPPSYDAVDLQRDSSARRHAFRPVGTDTPEVLAAIRRADAGFPAPSSPLRAASVLGFVVWLSAALWWAWYARDRAGAIRHRTLPVVAIGATGYVVWLAATAFM